MATTINSEATYKVNIGGRELSINTGELAQQAGGAVVVRYGDTVVLGTANLGEPLYDDADFLPLLVDYEEKFYASGKIKGSRYVKREGRPSEEATLTARLIDRSLRPLFPEGMINDVQVVLTILSYDGENDPDIPAMIAAGAALTVSDVPWGGPSAAVRIGQIDGQLVVNPTSAQRAESDLDLIISGTDNRAVMIEAGGNEVSEELVLEAVDEAQKELGKIAKLIDDLGKAEGKTKQEPTVEEVDDAVVERLQALARPILQPKLTAARLKQDFEQAEGSTVAQVLEQLTDEEKETISEKTIAKAVHDLRGMNARERALNDNWREGGRGLDEVRKLTVRAGILPRTHGSAIFQRGETQILNVTTLGGPAAVQHIDTMEVEAKKRYIHHYNFPAFSVGENKPNRGPGRREIGHGALAERALLPVLPDKEEWAYTMLLVSEVLGSNGSSSMGSVCGSSLSLMDAGVPIKKAVAGIAIGLFSDGDNYKILTDIAGVEDEKGDMDFKVAGTADGITALQMDIKAEGVGRKVLAESLVAARKARLHILKAMDAVIDKPREEMSPYAPRIHTLRISVEKIGDLIGPKGKNINEIVEETGVEIDIEDDGLVSITARDGEAMEKAKALVHNLTREIKAGEKFEGKVVRVLDFGAFVELTPNTDGMVHISQFRDTRVENINDVVKVGDVIPVVVIEVDNTGRISLSHKAALPGGSAETDSGFDRGSRSRNGGKGGNLSSGENTGPFNGPKPPR